MINTFSKPINFNGKLSWKTDNGIDSKDTHFGKDGLAVGLLILDRDTFTSPFRPEDKISYKSNGEETTYNGQVNSTELLNALNGAVFGMLNAPMKGIRLPSFAKKPTSFCPFVEKGDLVNVKITPDKLNVQIGNEKIKWVVEREESPKDFDQAVKIALKNSLSGLY